MSTEIRKLEELQASNSLSKRPRNVLSHDLTNKDSRKFVNSTRK